MTEPTQRERLATLETRVAHIDTKLDSIDRSLKDLVALKHKGAGALWLIGILGVSAIIAGAKAFYHWIAG